ncbi:MAG: DcaP family trimeric outer membrane transporter [Oligoflexia bacterium]|nr:DcaP family trimeric outer membrane transporter [Oligoflexia bacterium]
MGRDKLISAAVQVGAIVLSGFSLSRAIAAETPPSFEVYGFGQSDYIQDIRRVDPNWEDTLRPSKIPTAAGEYGSDGQASISVKQSRLGVKGSMPVDGNDLFTKIEFDFFGVGADAGQTTIRLRHAYGQWGEWLGGQTNSLFMDGDVFPNVIDYWGPAGMVFLRTPQIRWTPFQGDYELAFAIEKPDLGIDVGNIRYEDPKLGANIQNDLKAPDLTGQFRANRPWGHVQLAGILRRVGYDTVGNSTNDPKDHLIGWGFDLTSNIKTIGQDKVDLGAVYGKAIAAYMNDGGVDLAPQGVPGSLQAETVPLWGIVAYYDRYWNDHFSTSVGYSRTQVSNRSFQAGDAFHSGEYASINLLYTPVKNVLMGAEYLWGRRVDNNFNSGDDTRTQVTFKYSFSSKDVLGNRI